ncbi:MAG TPA: GNAT family N-acetyltransferase [Actinomycetota bacterium]|nr:GNAT family N-acetyltransferase [Actinomycetota bacterium]
MTDQPFIVRAMREDERDLVRTLHRRAFNIPADLGARLPQPPAESVRVADAGGRLIGALRYHEIGHFFGGRSVPSAGIGGVVVEPEARGDRTAERLVVATLAELREKGSVISVLYPATVPVYRRCGYEYAAFRVNFKTQLRLLPRAGGPQAEAWTDDDLDEIAEVYRSWASGRNGPVDRPSSWWTRVLENVEEGPVYRVCVREDGRITGYMVYTQEKRKDSDWEFDLDVRDLVWTTRTSIDALLTFAGRHRSNARDLLWVGPPQDALADLLPEQDADYDHWFRPMLRLVDVPGAFEARGYQPALRAAVELTVDDAQLPANAGGWRVETSDGSAKVSPANDARARVDVGALAAIWAGFLSASDARRLGRLDASDDEVAVLEEMFAGPLPWVNDWF